jgi:hypothetical protein
MLASHQAHCHPRREGLSNPAIAELPTYGYRRVHAILKRWRPRFSRRLWNTRAGHADHFCHGLHRVSSFGGNVGSRSCFFELVATSGWLAPPIGAM